MLRLSRDLASRRPIELDSQEWYEFSARKSCFRKRTAIRERTDSVRHYSVLCWRSEKTVENPRQMQSLRTFLHLTHHFAWPARPLQMRTAWSLPANASEA